MIQGPCELFDHLDTFERLPCALKTLFSLQIVRRDSGAQPVNRCQEGEVLELHAFVVDKSISPTI